MFHAGSDKKRIYLPVLGMFNVYNSLAALSCGYVLGFQLDEMAEAISTFKGVKGRLEYLKTGRNFDIIIDFAHTPQSLKELIQTVKTLTQGRVIVLFGCGGDRDGSKRQLMGRIATMYAAIHVLTSDNPRRESPHDIIADILKGVTGSSYISIVDREEAIRYAVEIAKPSDCVILAGKGHEDYQILSDRTIHFDEREIVKKILNEKI